MNPSSLKRIPYQQQNSAVEHAKLLQPGRASSAIMARLVSVLFCLALGVTVSENLSCMLIADYRHMTHTG